MATKGNGYRNDSKRKAYVSGRLHRRMRELATELSLKILHAAGRRTMARDKTGKFALMSVEDVVLAAREVFPTALDHYERGIKEFEQKNVRRAS
jgi:hypothetical protein